MRSCQVVDKDANCRPWLKSVVFSPNPTVDHSSRFKLPGVYLIIQLIPQKKSGQTLLTLQLLLKSCGYPWAHLKSVIQLSTRLPKQFKTCWLVVEKLNPKPCDEHKNINPAVITGPTSLYRFRNFRDQRREWKFSLSVLFPDFNQNLHIGIQRLKTFKNGRCDHLIPCFFVYHNMWYSSSKILPWWIFDICPGKKSSFELVSKYINKKNKW